MILQDKINIFINKAQSKISELALLTADDLDEAYAGSDNVDLSVELIDVLETLQDPLLDWSTSDIESVIDYYTIRAGLNDLGIVVFTDKDTIISEGSGGDYTWVPSFNALNQKVDDNHTYVLSEIDRLDDKIDNLDFSGLVPQDLIDEVDANSAARHTHDNKPVLDNITQADLDAIGQNTAHRNNPDKHVSLAQKNDWDSRVTQQELTDGLAEKAALVHGHEMEDINGLQEAFDGLAPEKGDPGEDGSTPVLVAGTIGDGEYSITIDDSDPLNPILNLVVPKGEDGEDFNIDVYGQSGGRLNPIYDGEEEGFAYLGVDNGVMYYRRPFDENGDPLSAASATGWYDVPFVGNNGWSPILGALVVDNTKTVMVLNGWTGGQGDMPSFGTEGQLTYMGPNGFTQDINEATNIRGNQGEQGDRGKAVFPDASGVLANGDRDQYDEEFKDFFFYDNVEGLMYIKLSDTTADWSLGYQWKGDKGDKGEQGEPGDGGTGGGFTTQVISNNTIAQNNTIYLVNTAGGMVTVTLPDADSTDFQVKIYKISPITDYDVEVITVGGQEIGNSATQKIYGESEGFHADAYIDQKYVIIQDNRGAVQRKLSQSSGVLDVTGFQLTDNGNGTINIGPGVYSIEDPKDLYNPTSTIVRFLGVSNYAVTNVNVSGVTSISINEQGNLSQSLIGSSQTDHVSFITIAAVSHVLGDGTIQSLFRWFTPAQNPSARLTKLMNSLGVIKKGVNITGTTAGTPSDKRIAISGGTIVSPGVQNDTDPSNPDTSEVTAQDPVEAIQYFTRAGFYGVSNQFDTVNYNPTGDTVEAIPQGGNNATINRVYVDVTGNVSVQYGQMYYASRTAALEALSDNLDVFEPNPIFSGIAVLSALVVAETTAADMTDLDDVTIIPTGPLGDVSQGAASSAIVSLQKAYENSTQPQITTDLVRGAVQMKEGTGDDTASVHQILNSDGDVVVDFTAEEMKVAPGYVVPGAVRALEVNKEDADTIRAFTGYLNGDNINNNTTGFNYEFVSASLGVDDGTETSEFLKPNDIDIASQGRHVKRQEFALKSDIPLDYENIIFEEDTVGGRVMRGFIFKAISKNDYGGVSSLKYSNGNVYTLGNPIAPGDYIDVSADTLGTSAVLVVESSEAVEVTFDVVSVTRTNAVSFYLEYRFSIASPVAYDIPTSLKLTSEYIFDGGYTLDDEITSGSTVISAGGSNDVHGTATNGDAFNITLTTESFDSRWVVTGLPTIITVPEYTP